MLLEIDYHPRQGQVSYKDAYKVLVASTPLNRWVHSFWQLNVPAGKFWYRSVPDNSVDWIINIDHPEDSILVPPFLSSMVFELSGPVSYFGVRFRLLGHQGLISTPLGEWKSIGDVISTSDVIPDHQAYSVFDSIQRGAGFEDRCAEVSMQLLSMVKQPVIDRRVVNYIRYCHQTSSSHIRLSDKQCSEFGVSARQLRRLTQQNLGLVPRDFARVLRFQHTLNKLSSEKHEAAWIDHYHDQSHYIREFKRFSGLTPAEFRKLSVLYNQKTGT